MPYSIVTKFLQDLVFWTLHKNTRYYAEICSKATNENEILNKILQLFVLCQIFNKNSAIVCLGFAPNQIKIKIFHYTRCKTPERVTSWRGPSPRHCARATQLLSKKMSQRWRAVGNTVSDLTGPRFEPQTSRSRDERVTARPTGLNIAN